MEISAIHVCPVRGLSTLDPPDPRRMGEAARAAKNLGLKKLLVPVLEESLLRITREKVRFLDGLVEAMDQMASVPMEAWLVAPAQKILGLYWIPPYLAGATPDPGARPAFVDGKVRNLRPYRWWTDPSIMEKRLAVFRELLLALKAHPAIRGYILMDRELEWARPDAEVADLLLKSYIGEVREQAEDIPIYLGLGWKELLEPGLSLEAAGQVNGIKMNGLDEEPVGIDIPGHPAGEMFLTAYIGALSHWLFNKPVEIVSGWHLTKGKIDRDHLLELLPGLLSGRGISGVIWPSLIDPEPSLADFPPWFLEPEMKEISLLDSGAEPKDGAEALLKVFRSCTPEANSLDFVDISGKEYAEDPDTHFKRLWNHFRESADP
ncbi:MAG: hypothetical protein JRJ29_03605 [Deltaproteobacteria bacterium]|nr:hypothetical protein [Deltaproteobacteria bacterium]